MKDSLKLFKIGPHVWPKIASESVDDVDKSRAPTLAPMRMKEVDDDARMGEA